MLFVTVCKRRQTTHTSYIKYCMLNETIRVFKQNVVSIASLTQKEFQITHVLCKCEWGVSFLNMKAMSDYSGRQKHKQ